LHHFYAQHLYTDLFVTCGADARCLVRNDNPLAGFSGTLVLSQEGSNRLYAPIWLDCDARRIGRSLTWRQLTVADTRIILPRHQAAGFRVQAVLDQWLVYRALDAARNRTVLGCNVSCEFLVGRVRKSGEIARTLEIQ
jgi:hypothetical protein